MELYTIVYFLVSLAIIVVGSKEILIDDENHNVQANSIQSVDSEENGSKIGFPCHVEYQVTKRVLGHCMKLGKTARGCVAGNYLEPFHPECM